MRKASRKRRRGCGKYSDQRVEPGIGLFGFRDRLKAGSQAGEQAVLPFTWVLAEEPLGCDILQNTAKTLGTGNFYIKYILSLLFGSTVFSPNPKQL